MHDGSFVALVTPFAPSGAVDHATLRRLMELHCAQGTDGIVPCGTTGESPTLSPGEIGEIVASCVEAARGRLPVIAGCGSNDTAKAIRLARAVKEAGATGGLAVTPYYNRPSQEGLYRHFSACADAVDLPLLLYNVPSRTGVNLLPATVARLASHPNIAGIKEASGSIAQVQEILDRCPPGFSVLSGDDALTLPIMALGGRGVVSVVANLVPGPVAELVASARKGDWGRARELHFRLAGLVAACFLETNPVPVKDALAVLGWPVGAVRPPLAPLAAENRRLLIEALQRDRDWLAVVHPAQWPLAAKE